MPEYSAIYEDAVDKIQSVYYSCSKSEQKLLRNILQEMSIKGYSETLEKIWLNDFKSIPVGIDEFICDPYYLGETNDFGNNVYPFWRQTFREIFNAGNKYNEILLSGATRTGKSTSSVTIMAYMLYRLMLYRDPHQYFHKKAISRFTLGFANLTKELALSVCYREFNDTLKASPWFCERGSFTRSDRNFYYLPEGDKIEIIPASSGEQLLGKQVWCLVGDTEILTQDGIRTLAECSGSYQTVFQHSESGELISAEAFVAETKQVTETIRIELEDGTVIEGTPEHQIMLSDGTYKALGDLSSLDDLLTFNISKEVDEMNLKDQNPQFSVYIHTSPKGKKYVGITTKRPEERWMKGGKGYCENAHFWNAIQKYGWDNFEHEIVATGLNLHEASDMEAALISKYDCMNPEKGYNHTTGGNWSTPDEQTRKKLSRSISRRCADPVYRKKMSDVQKGHVVSEETRKKISVANTGRKLSEAECERRRQYRPSPETLEKLRGLPAWNKGLTKETDERLQKVSENMKGRVYREEWRQNLSKARKQQYVDGYNPVWINNGKIETSIQKGDPVPEGFQLGRLSILDTYIHKGEVSKKIKHEDLQKYLAEGWEKGRPASVNSNIRKSLQKMHWEYDGQRFDRAADLANYLNNHGYPRIVESTITSLSKKGFETSPTYRSLAGKVICIKHEN